MAFLEHSTDLNDVRSRTEFAKCLQDTYLLVMECREWSILHITWEVVVRQKFSGLKSRLKDIQRSFGLELLMKLKGSASANSQALRNMATQMSEVKVAMGTGSDDRKILLEGVRRLQIDVRDSRREMMSLRPARQLTLDTIRLPDSKVKVTELSLESRPMRGLFEGLSVIFEEIVAPSSITSDLPRIVKLYQEMCDVAQIQRLFGIAENEGVLYAIMEDMGGHLSLESIITQDVLSGFERIQRLRIAYETAATISALHASGILVKVISDTTIHLESQPNGSVRPRLSQLGHARRIWEVSSHDPQDARFDAPETPAAESRSKMSDIWSLGVLLLELFTGKFPFDTQRRVDDESERKRIRDLLQSGRQPFAYDVNNGNPPMEIAIAMRCILSDPYLRPTSSWISEQLFDLVIREAASIEQSVGTVPTEGLTETKGLDDLAKSIRDACIKKHSKDPTIEQIRIDQAQVKILETAAEGDNPIYAFVLGLAYTYDLVHLASDEDALLVSSQEQHQAQCARRGIPYLEKAQQIGHVGAIKELARAHKVLFDHYYGLYRQELGN
ncbi:Fc.00g071530.m01.CDS01 [Cosmosporella sp. VM-42]